MTRVLSAEPRSNAAKRPGIRLIPDNIMIFASISGQHAVGRRLARRRCLAMPS